MDYQTIKQRLLDPGNRHHCQTFVCSLNEPGVYGLFAHDGRDDAFEDLGLPPCERRLLYVGVAATRLSARYHPAEASSRTSSPRLSFGALLYEKLNLEMLPRSADARAHWKFKQQSEAELSRWVKEKLVPRPAPCELKSPCLQTWLTGFTRCRSTATRTCRSCLSRPCGFCSIRTSSAV